MKFIGMVAGVCVAAALLAGCTRGEERRASAEFHAEAVRFNLDLLRTQIGNHDDGYAMALATSNLTKAMDFFPQTVKDKAKTRLEDRLAAASKAQAQFIQIAPKLNSLNYEDDWARQQLDELDRLISDVEKS